MLSRAGNVGGMCAAHSPYMSPRWLWLCCGSGCAGCVWLRDLLLDAGCWPRLKLWTVAPRRLPLGRRAHSGRIRREIWHSPRPPTQHLEGVPSAEALDA